jgi:hypothetical protein
MSLTDYFNRLIDKVESSDDVVTNQDTDEAGFYRPTRTILITHLNKLKDLHAKPLAKPMVKDSWKFVVEHLPPEWLILSESEKAELKKMLS